MSKKIPSDTLQELQEAQSNEKFYKGNENLPSQNTSFVWTDDMKAEIKLCIKSILNFAETHFHIITEEGRKKIELFKFQKNILKMLKANRFSVILSARQMGKSTVVSIYALWVACFHDEKNIVIIANKEQTAQELFERIRMAYEQLPNWLKPGIKSWRKDGLNLVNGSKITISSTSSSAARGGSVNVLIIDEFAYIEPKVLNDLWRSAIPTISSFKKSQIVVISTQNGPNNRFYELYTKAEKGENGWAHIKVDWWERPDRDENWKEDQIKLLGSLKEFNQEFGTTFLDDNDTSVLDEDLLIKMRQEVSEPNFVLDEGDYKIWKKPEPHHLYSIGVDIGEGVGRNYSVAQILDITDLKNIEQVAVYSNNTLDPFHFASKLMEIAEQWGEPPLCVERNNSGARVIDVLAQTYNYEGLVTYTHKTFEKTIAGRQGILANTNTKWEGIQNLRYWTNKLRVVKINDIATVQEFETFVKQPNDTWSSKSSKFNDDMVMSLIWGIFILNPKITPRYFEIIDTDQQGMPMTIAGIYDKSFQISQSTLNRQYFVPKEDSAKKREAQQYAHYINPSTKEPVDEDRQQLLHWLLNI
jgi:hypothetical protein